MFEIIKAIVLGIVQGLTEFIPVSSSAHLVLTPYLLEWPQQDLFFDLVLHWGTLLAVFAFFGRDLWMIITATLRSIFTRDLSDANARIGWFVVIATLPAIITGVLIKDFVEALFDSPRAAATLLWVTVFVLILSEQIAKRLKQPRNLEQFALRDALAMGIGQAVALAPGISRSGSTIAAGLICGVRRDVAARVSFLMSIPAILGAGLLQTYDVLQAGTDLASLNWIALGCGFAASALTGFAAITFLLRYLRTNSLYIFAIYCAILSTVVLLFF